MTTIIMRNNMSAFIIMSINYIRITANTINFIEVVDIRIPHCGTKSFTNILTFWDGIFVFINIFAFFPRTIPMFDKQSRPFEYVCSLTFISKKTKIYAPFFRSLNPRRFNRFFIFQPIVQISLR